MARFQLSDVSERIGLLRTGRIAAGIAARGIDDGHTLVLLLDQFGDVGRNFNVIIRMTENSEYRLCSGCPVRD
jgi:hypothetical protein